MSALPSFAFHFNNGSWKGYNLAHLLAMHFWETGTGENRLQLFFSTESLLIQGSGLNYLVDQISSGKPFEPKTMSPGYKITGIRSLKYMD